MPSFNSMQPHCEYYSGGDHGSIQPTPLRSMPPRNRILKASRPLQTSQQTYSRTMIRPQSRPSIRLDEATRSRLLQLYTMLQPITNPSQIQSHFTCFYLTRSNVTDALKSCSKMSLSHLLTTPSPSGDLSSLLQQSWRTTPKVLDFLELVWTGQRPNQNWTDVLGLSHNTDYNVETLALNLAITYSYSSEGQPTLSLVAIAITEEAFDVINQHTQSSSNPLPNFTTLPPVHEPTLISTIDRIRNADVHRILTQAARGRSWTGQVQHMGQVSPDNTIHLSPVNMPEEVQIDNSNNNNNEYLSSPSHPRATLAPGQDSNFCRVALVLHRITPREWTRRSSQIDAQRQLWEQMQMYMQGSKRLQLQTNLQTRNRVERWTQAQT